MTRPSSAAPPRRSLRRTLIWPCVAMASMVAALTVWDTRREAASRLEWEVGQRAQLVAHLVEHAARLTAGPELQRLVLAVSEDGDVLDVTVVAGAPATVRASTKTARLGTPLTSLDEADDVQHLSAALDRRSAVHQVDSADATYDLAIPLLVGATPGAALVRLDTRPLAAVVLRSTIRLTATALIGILIVSVLIYVLLRLRVLTPVAAIAEAVRRHNEQDDAAWAAVATGDELEQLAVTLRESLVARARVEAALRLSERMASIGGLAAGLAHEINTPVQFAGDSVQFLREGIGETIDVLQEVEALAALQASGASDEVLREALARLAPAISAADLPYLQAHLPRALDRCEEGLGRVAQIVRSLQESADPVDGAPAPGDVNRAVRNALTLARNEYKYVADIQTEFEDLPPVVFRASDLHQVVLHLVVHAAHAIGDVVKGRQRRGVIVVHTARERDAVLIRVRHTGLMPADTPGLGLAMAERIITQGHGGTFAILPADDLTTIEVRLPVAGRAAAQEAA